MRKREKGFFSFLPPLFFPLFFSIFGISGHEKDSKLRLLCTVTSEAFAQFFFFFFEITHTDL